MSAFWRFGITYLKISLHGVKTIRMTSRDALLRNWAHKDLIESTEVQTGVRSFFTDISQYFLSASFNFLIMIISRGSHKIQNMIRFFRWPHLLQMKFWKYSEMLIFPSPSQNGPGSALLWVKQTFKMVIECFPTVWDDIFADFIAGNENDSDHVTWCIVQELSSQRSDWIHTSSDRSTLLLYRHLTIFFLSIVSISDQIHFKRLVQNSKQDQIL